MQNLKYSGDLNSEHSNSELLVVRTCLRYADTPQQYSCTCFAQKRTPLNASMHT